MDHVEFWQRKANICHIYNGDPGTVKRPHFDCPFQIAMRYAGIQDEESCNQFIAEHPKEAEQIIATWYSTFVPPSNQEVFERTLKEIDCRYAVENGNIFHNGQHVGALDPDWMNQPYSEY